MIESPGTVHGRQQYMPTLDGWRAIAILLVLLDHAGDELLRLVPGLGAHSHLLASTHYAFIKDPVGRGGVHLFFALSGYLITQRLLEEERASGVVSLSRFYLRRLFRIQPAALFFLCVVALLGAAGIVPLTARAWFASLFAAANLTLPWQSWYTSHFWSLAVEEHFYVVWPALFVVLGLRRRLGVALTLVCALGLWCAFVLSTHLTQSPYMWVRTDIEGPWLLWGCIAALAQGSSSAAPLVRALSRPGISLIALPLAFLSVTLMYTRLDWRIDLATTFLCAACTPLLFIGTVQRPRGLLGRFLQLPPLPWLGRISFSVYLWQQLFFVWDDYRVPGLGRWQYAPWQILATLVTATASFYLLEKPAIRLGHRLLGRPGGSFRGSLKHPPGPTSPSPAMNAHERPAG